MRHSCGRWAAGVLAAVCVLLAAAAAFVWAADPCFYVRLPKGGRGVFFNERYQNAGLLRHARADTVVLGTSMVANYRPSQIQAVFDGLAVKLTVPDGYMSEFDTTLSAVFRTHPPRRVLFGLDPNILIRDESGLTGALPEYLYNDDPLDDARYFLNRDTLYYGIYSLLTLRGGGGTALDDAFTWDGDIWWNHMTALDNYDRPAVSQEQLPAEAYLENAQANLAVICRWAETYPDTKFDIFFPPYSLLYWDKTIRQGETEAVFAALELACGMLTQQDNIRLHAPLLDAEIVTNLDYYCDYIHCSGEADALVLERIADGTCLLTAEDAEEKLAGWREFVVNYDYDQLWTDAFWWKWNIDHGAPVVWQPGS